MSLDKSHIFTYLRYTNHGGRILHNKWYFKFSLVELSYNIYSDCLQFLKPY